MAVYTEVNEEELGRFMTDYDVGPAVAFKGIAEGVENTNYLLRTATGDFILTLYEKRVRGQDLPYFLALMEHLAGRGVPCPLPLRGRDGAPARRLNGRPAAVVTFLDGICVDNPGPGHCAALGKAVAGLHVAGADFDGKRANDLSRGGWRRLFERCAGDADKVKPGLARLLASELAYLDRHWPEALPEGVIHADLFPDNVLFLDNRLSGIIDFYFACNDFLAYELAICLNAWCFDANAAFLPANARALFGAYEAVRPLRGDEKQALPVLARAAALRFLLTRLFDWLNRVDGALVKCKDPLDYVARLDYHRRVGGLADYGIA